MEEPADEVPVLVELRAVVLVADEAEDLELNRLVAPRKPERLLLEPPAELAPMPEDAPELPTEAALEDELEAEEPPPPPPPPPRPPPPIPPIPPPMSTVTIMPPPAACTLTLAPRPPRSCGVMRLTYFSAVVVPARRNVFSSDPATTGAVRTRASACAPEREAGESFRHAHHPPAAMAARITRNNHGWPLRRRMAGFGSAPGAMPGCGSGAGCGCGCIRDSWSLQEWCRPSASEGWFQLAMTAGRAQRLCGPIQKDPANAPKGSLFLSFCRSCATGWKASAAAGAASGPSGPNLLFPASAL